MARGCSLSRRQFLAAGSSLAGASLAGGIYWTRHLWGQGPPSGDRYASKGGLLEAPLEARFGPGQVIGRPANVFSFNGRVPAPLLEARAGDTIRIPYINLLPEVSNIHYHGLHVDPTGRADNVFLEIQPGEPFLYDFTVPPYHPAGTFWYHPHVHGSTARQLGGGMVGMLIVRGELDDIPEIAAATEYFLILKDFGIRPDGTAGPGPSLTVNGRENPTLAIQQGGLIRLRVLNASIDRYFRLQLEEHPLHQIGTDGGGLPQRVAMDELLMAPAERSDILILGDRPPGSYRLLTLPYQSQIADLALMPEMDTPAQTAPQVLATITYQGRADRTVGLPDRLVTVDPLPPPTLPLRTFDFHTTALPGGFVFQINGKDFDHHRVDTEVLLDTIEDWEITNSDPLDHPIHLHTNSFQILGTDGRPERAWRDIMNVKAQASRRFRVQFLDYPGRAVYHCHRVAHGDLGMMAVIEMQNSFPPRARIR